LVCDVWALALTEPEPDPEPDPVLLLCGMNKSTKEALMEAWRKIAGPDAPTPPIFGSDAPPSPPPRPLVRQAISIRVSDPIPPGGRATITSKPKKAFRAERLVISSASFPVPALRRFWTWPLLMIGYWLGRAHRRLAKWLGVDLHASHEAIEILPDDFAPTDPENYRDDDPSITFDFDEGRYIRTTPIPYTIRERLLAPLGTLAWRFEHLRVHWQQRQLADVVVCNILVGTNSQLAQPGALPADMFATPAIDAFVMFDSCEAEQTIALEVANGNRRPCYFTAAWVGVGAS
jgi:hypothetical protein